MKKMRIVSTVLLSFLCLSALDTTWASLNDLAIYRPGVEEWMTPVQQQECADYIMDNVVAKTEATFAGYQQSVQDSLSTWISDHMSDGESDILMIVDMCPAVLYEGQLNGSLAEAWMENGNMLIWTGSEPFFSYVNADGSKSDVGAGTEGASDVLDVSSPQLCRGGGLQKVTSAVADYNMISFAEYDAERSLKYDQLLIDSLSSDRHHMSYWRVDEVFAEDSEFYRSDSIVLVNEDNGQFAQFYCKTGDITGPDGTQNVNYYRKRVLAQFLNNWVSLPCDTLVVPDDYSTIQDAIDAAQARDTVLVKAGTYNEQLVMKKGIKLVSDSSDDGNDLLPGPGYADTAYGVESKRVLRRAMRTIIDGTGFPSGTEADPMVDFPKGTTVGTLLDGFTVRNMPTVDHTIPGHSHVIQCRGASGTMINNIVHENGSSGLGSHAWFYDQEAPLEERDFRYSNIQYDSHPIIINNVVYRNEGNNLGNNHYAYAIFYNNECFENISIDGHDSPGIGNQHGAHALIVGNLVYKSDWVGIGARKGEEQGAYPINRPTHPIIRRNSVYDSGENDPTGDQGAGIGADDTGGYDPKLGMMVYQVIEGNYVNGARQAAIGCRSSDPTLGHVKIINNEVLNGGSGSMGAGIGLDGATALEIVGNISHDNNDAGIGIRNGGHADLIQGNKIFNNSAAGIGIAGSASSVGEVRNNVIYDNTTAGIGLDGAIALQIVGNSCHGNNDAGIGIENGGHADLIQSNEIFNNGAAGISIADEFSSVGQIRKNVIRDNVRAGIAGNGPIGGTYNNIVFGNGLSGIVCFVSPVEVINNVFANNGMLGIDNLTEAPMTIKNNICYYNSTPGIVSDLGGYSYNCLFANNLTGPCTDCQEWCWRPQYAGKDPGPGDLLYDICFHPVDPLFVDPQNHDFHLQGASPAIDTGDPTIVDADATRSDMGAYGGPDPFEVPVAGFTAANTNIVGGDTVNFTDLSTGTVTSWSWNFGDGGTSSERHPSYTYDRSGTYTVSLTVTGPGGSDTETKTGYIHVAAVCMDNDGDGYGYPGDASCLNGSAEDCNDSDNSIYPGATEITCNGIDENCNGVADDAPDSDGDGHSDCVDAFPDDPNEWLDTDADGIGNNADPDDDNDDLPDVWELFYSLDPLDDSGDNGKNGDPDNDNWTNYQEYLCGSNPKDHDSAPPVAIHRSTWYGVNRSGAPYSTGDCAHCHETFQQSICGVNKYNLFYDDWVNQDDLFCIECHSDSTDPQQVHNDTYSVTFGGEASAPEYDTIKEQFNDGTAEHDLSTIRDVIDNNAYGWGFGSDPDPCVACHAPHSAQRSVPVIIEGGKLNTAIRRPSHYKNTDPADIRWGDDAGERMSDYVAQFTGGVYQAPYYGVYPSGVYEPSGNASPDDGSDMPDYVTFCLDCHQYAIGSLAAVDWANVAHGGLPSRFGGVTGFIPPYIDGTSNYVLSCLDCHEPHGSPGPTRSDMGLIRGWVNGQVTYPSSIGDYNTFCGACHSDHTTMDACQVCHLGELEGSTSTAHDPLKGWGFGD